MTPDTEALVKAMDEAAKLATPGPYTITTCSDYWLEAEGRGIALFGEISWCGANNEATINTQPEMKANARFHALCTPENIQSLTAKIAELVKEIEDFRSCLATASGKLMVVERKLAEVTKERDEARKANRQNRRLISATHKNAVKHENCETPHCPICEGGLFVCADCGAIEIETEEGICSAAEARATALEERVKGLLVGIEQLIEHEAFMTSTLGDGDPYITIKFKVLSEMRAFEDALRTARAELKGGKDE